MTWQSICQILDEEVSQVAIRCEPIGCNSLEIWYTSNSVSYTDAKCLWELNGYKEDTPCFSRDHLSLVHTLATYAMDFIINLFTRIPDDV